MDDKDVIKDNFVVGDKSIKVQAEKTNNGVGLVRLLVPADNMRGFHGRALTLESARTLVDRMLHAVNWLEKGEEKRMF